MSPKLTSFFPLCWLSCNFHIICCSCPSNLNNFFRSLEYCLEWDLIWIEFDLPSICHLIIIEHKRAQKSNIRIVHKKVLKSMIQGFIKISHNIFFGDSLSYGRRMVCISGIISHIYPNIFLAAQLHLCSGLFDALFLFQVVCGTYQMEKHKRTP